VMGKGSPILSCLTCGFADICERCEEAVRDLARFSCQVA